jgi:hypothetical protein
MKNVCGVCYAAVVMSCGGVWGMMDETKKNGEFVQLANLKQSDPSFYAPICIDFPYFLGCCGTYPEKWPIALVNISQNVSILQSAHFEDLAYARLAIVRMSSSYAFKEIVKFCESDLCDAGSREALSSLFHLVPMVIRGLPILSEKGKAIKGVLTSYFPDKVIADYTTFLEKMTSTKHLVSMEDASLFQSVSNVVNTHMDSNF